MSGPEGQAPQAEKDSRLIAELRAQAKVARRHGFVQIGFAGLTLAFSAVLYRGSGVVGLVFPGSESSQPIGFALRAGAALLAGISVYFLREASRGFSLWRTKAKEIVNALVLEEAGNHPSRAQRLLDVIRSRPEGTSTSETKRARASVGDVILASLQVLVSWLATPRARLSEPRALVLPAAEPVPTTPEDSAPDDSPSNPTLPPPRP